MMLFVGHLIFINFDGRWETGVIVLSCSMSNNDRAVETLTDALCRP